MATYKSRTCHDGQQEITWEQLLKRGLSGELGRRKRKTQVPEEVFAEA
jgi:hypothetical protein